MEKKTVTIYEDTLLEFTKTVDKSNQRHTIITACIIAMVMLMWWLYFKTDYQYPDVTNNQSQVGISNTESDK